MDLSDHAWQLIVSSDEVLCVRSHASKEARFSLIAVSELTIAGRSDLTSVVLLFFDGLVAAGKGFV